jgi:hypothetical protein
MRSLAIIAVGILLLAFLGCSGKSNIPTTPGPGDVSNNSPSVVDEGAYQVIGMGQMNLDTGGVEPLERSTYPYLNITSLLGSNFSFTIDGIVPPDILDITLRINNFSTLTAYDVVIVFEDLFGKKIMNADSYMDIFQPYDIDPFIAFRKESPTRAFPPGLDTEELLLKFPGGASPNVNFFILAHLPGNTGGVYEIRDWKVVSGMLTPSGGTVNVEVKVIDYQDDLMFVAADTTALTGGLTFFTRKPAQYTWGAAITHSTGKPAGKYPILCGAQSPADPAYLTYNWFELEVMGGGGLVCDISTDPDPPSITQGDPIEFDGSGSYGDNPITTYEWDFDYDGTDFSAEAEGPIVDHYICSPGETLVALRITDNTMASSICTVTVDVAVDSGPVGGWGTDRKLADSTLGPFILNISHRAIHAHGNELDIVFNSVNTGSYNIYLMKSEDLGQTWSDPIPVTSYPDADGSYAEYANIWHDDNTGDLFVRFDYDLGVGIYEPYITRSHDGGLTWSTPIRMTTGVEHVANRYNGAIVIDDSVDPSILYCSYYDETNLADLDVYIATTTTDNFSTWANYKVDDSAIGSIQPSIFVNPIDHSINMAWCDPYYYSGAGQVLFDRSTNNGKTWGTDRVIDTPPIDEGPYEVCLAINPASGIPGVLYRGRDNTIPYCFHWFCRASNPQGTSWWNPYDLTGDGSADCWAGTLDVTEDGHWVAVFEEDPYDWLAMFTQSTDDGVNWTTSIPVDDAGWIWNVSMDIDDCKDVHVTWADYRTNEYELYYDVAH